MSAAAASARKTAAPDARAAELSVDQVKWLGVLLVGAQLPHFAFVPIWVAIFGPAFVFLRLFLLWRSMSRNDAALLRIAPWALVLFAAVAGIGVRLSYGYFLGRDPCVAFLFTLVGIKFLEARSPRDGTVLVCLASFLFVTPFFYSQSMLAGVVAIPAVLLIAATLEVLAKPAAHRIALAEWIAALRRAGKLLLQGVPLAALLFVLFPRLAAPLWGLPSDHAASTGLSDKMKPGSIADLSLSDSVAFRVDFDGPAPPPPQRYWRGPVLTRFDGSEWSAQPQRLDGVPARPNARSVSYTVTLEPHNKPWLFALDLPAGLPRLATPADEMTVGPEIAALTRDQQLLGRTLVTQSLRYQQRSNLGDRYKADPARDAQDNVRLPQGRRAANPKTLEYAQQLRAEHPDDTDYINAILRWFATENFVYTLAPPYMEHDPVDLFLFDTRRGFCEHYASAFVVLLRAAGIPARVVTGYQGGEMNPHGGYMIVRQSDAHAWAEALMGGEWVRFDPTGAVAPSRIEMGLGGSLPAGERIPLLARLDVGWLKGMQLAWDALNHDWRRNIIGFNYEKQRSLWRDLRVDQLSKWQYMLMLGAMAAVWFGLLFAWVVWRRRHDRVRARWNALCARLARAGLPRLPHEGPVAYAARAAEHWPRFAASFRKTGDLYALLRYGPESAKPDYFRARARLLAQFEIAIRALPGVATLRAQHAG